MSTTNENKTEQETIPHWARHADGVNALKGIDDAIADLKRGHERALDRAVRQVWLNVLDTGEILQVIATIRQSLAVAQLVRERVMSLMTALKERDAG